MAKKHEKYLGVPFKHLGRDMSGLDCYGLPLMYYKDILGVDLKDWWYEQDWSKKGKNYFLERYEGENFERVDSPQKHDIVLFKMDIKSEIPNHAGIVITPPHVVLSAERSGVTYIDLRNNVFKRRVYGFYRLCQN